MFIWDLRSFQQITFGIVQLGGSRTRFLTKVFVNFFVHSTVTFENRKNKKTFDERNGESDRSGGRSSSFIVNKARISMQLQLQLNSLRKGVVCLEAWI
jgi:hypothetical protein